jgi:ABC-type transport system involved in cytochrome bd biosynthesis fused ATPase/permease subunit
MKISKELSNAICASVIYILLMIAVIALSNKGEFVATSITILTMVVFRAVCALEKLAEDDVAARIALSRLITK